MALPSNGKIYFSKVNSDAFHINLSAVAHASLKRRPFPFSLKIKIKIAMNGPVCCSCDILYLFDYFLFLDAKAKRRGINCKLF